MHFIQVFGALAPALAIGKAAKLPTQPAIQVRNAPGLSSQDTVVAIGRALAARDNEEEAILEGSTLINRQWVDAPLFSFGRSQDAGGNVTISGAVEISCITCYVKGNATARLSLENGLDTASLFQNLTAEFENKIENITDTTIDWLEDTAADVWSDLQDGIDTNDFQLEPLVIDFSVPNLTAIPEVNFDFNFDGLEIYMLLSTVLSGGAEYSLPLYTSQTPIGLGRSNDLFIGVIFTVELILGVEAEVDFTSGVHILVEDGLGLNVTLFGNDVSTISFNGAQYEFLPVTVRGASGTIKATLRVGVNAGLDIDVGSFITTTLTDASAGVELGVWMDVAEFATTFTGDLEDDAECPLKIDQSYQLAVGVAAGASVAIEDLTWGPTPETQTPLFYTTLFERCAITAESTATSTAVTTPAITARQDQAMETTTTEISETYTGVNCLETGIVNCPASLQTTVKIVTTKTLTSVIPEGSEATWPVETNTAVTPIPFNAEVQTVSPSSGSPTSYVPPPPPPSPSSSNEPASADPNSNDGEDNNVDSANEIGGLNTNLIIGLSVGLGVPFIMLVIGAIFWIRRGRYAAVPKEEKPEIAGHEPDDEGTRLQKIPTAYAQEHYSD